MPCAAKRRDGIATGKAAPAGLLLRHPAGELATIAHSDDTAILLGLHDGEPADLRWSPAITVSTPSSLD